MREIKFRVWDKNGEKYLPPHHFSIGCDDGRLRNKECEGCIYGVIVEQFTGLHDKNGKEIYEGDILRIPAKDKWEEVNYSAFEVFFHGNDCCDIHVGFQMNRMHNFGSLAGGYCGYQFKPETTAKFEIIGTIHDEVTG